MKITKKNELILLILSHSTGHHGNNVWYLLWHIIVFMCALDNVDNGVAIVKECVRDEMFCCVFLMGTKKMLDF